MQKYDEFFTIGLFLTIGWKSFKKIINKQAQPQAQPISLSQYADRIGDIKWHQVYNTFARQYKGYPNDPNVTKMGQALHQAATTNDMNLIAPFLTNQKIN